MKTAVHIVVSLAFLTQQNERADKASSRLVATYENVTSATGKLAREIEQKSDDGDSAEVLPPD